LKSTPKRDLVDVWNIPPTDYTLFKMDAYKTFAVLIAKGCPYQCTFCFWGRVKRRVRNPKYVLEDLKNLSEHGVRYVYFYDQLFTLDKDYVSKICKLIGKEGININWSCDARTDCINNEMLKEMKKSRL
jgi:radical SAM superfamily enzyme YgiQ (UPF0313 family)